MTAAGIDNGDLLLIQPVQAEELTERRDRRGTGPGQ